LEPAPLQNAAPRLSIVLRYVWSFILLIIALDVLTGILHGPHWLWNEARLAPAFSMMYGYRLYPGRDALAPIVGTLHAPAVYILYAGLAFLKDPTQALLAACTLSALLYFVPLVWLHLRAGGRNRHLIGLYGFLACSAIVLASPGTSYAAMSVHVDAGATAAAVLGAGLLIRPVAGLRTLVVSAILGVLSVACKQVMAPVPAALAVFVLLAGGQRIFLRYLLMQLASGLLVAAAILLIFRPPQDLLFNTYWLAAHRPPFGGEGRLLRGLYDERTALAAVIPVLFLLAARIIWLDTGSLRERLNRNRWLVFLVLAMFQLPFALRAWTTVGGDYNHLGVVTLFATLAVTVGLISPAGTELPAALPGALLAGIAIAVLPIPWKLPEAISSVRDNPAEIAFRYEELHPGRAYFPMNPLAALLAGGRLTHFDLSLEDREIAGCPITPAQFAAGLPPHYQLVAFAPGQEAPRSIFGAAQIRSMQPVEEPGLASWRVFAVRARDPH